MANVTLLSVDYQNVPSVELPKTGGGTASFIDVADTTATASDVAVGKYFYDSNGVRTEGTLNLFVTGSITLASGVSYDSDTRFGTVLRKAGEIVVLNTALQLTGSGNYFSTTYKKVATLPNGFRPTTRLMVPVNCGNTIWAGGANGKAQINTDGTIDVYTTESNTNHVQITAVFTIS